MINIDLSLAESEIDCLPQELENDKIIARCFEIKPGQFNTTSPKINVTFGETVTVQKATLKRLGDLDYNFTSLEAEDYFEEFDAYSNYDLTNIATGIYTPKFILSDGFYVFKIEAFNLPNIYLDVVVFFQVNASQMNLWVESPVNHSIPKPDFAASNKPINNLTIRTERPVEGCKHARGMAQGTAEDLYEFGFGDEFTLIDSDLLMLEDYDFRVGFYSGTIHGFNNLEVVCKEVAQEPAPSRYTYKRLYYIFLENAPQVELVPMPARVVDFRNRYSIFNITTSQTSACTIDVEEIPPTIQGANPLFKYDKNYVFTKKEYYKINQQQNINFSTRPNPYDFYFNVTCTNLANLSTTVSQKVEIDLAQTAEFIFTSPRTYVNSKSINVSGAFMTDNVKCEAKFNDLTQLRTLAYKGQILSGPNDGSYLYQATLNENTLVEGQNTVHVNCDFMPANKFNSKSFIVDLKPPTNMTITTTPNSCTLNRINAKLTAQDNNGVDYFEYELIYQGKKEGDFNREGTSATGSLTISFTSGQGMMLENDTFKLRARAVDRAGNPSGWAESTIKITTNEIDACDFKPPLLNIKSNYSAINKNWIINVSCLDDHSGCSPSFKWGTNTNTSDICSPTSTHSLTNILTINQPGLFCATVFDNNNNNATRTITLKVPEEFLDGCEDTCGGADCPLCLEGEPCTDNDDCYTNYCLNGICAIASCTDGIQNGLETDIDCGGPHCDSCDVGNMCDKDNDCATGNCLDGTCAEASCSNQKIDGLETDVDCGGPDCDPCALNKKCLIDRDCAEGKCINGLCKIPPEIVEPEPEKTGPRLLGLIFLILGILSMAAGGVLLYLESEKKKDQAKQNEANKMKAGLNSGIPRVTTLNDNQQPKIKTLTPQEIEMRKQAWEKAQIQKDQKRKELLGSFNAEADEKEEQKTDEREEKPEDKIEAKPDEKPKEKKETKPTPKTEKKEKEIKKDYLELDELHKKEDAFEKLKQTTSNSNNTKKEESSKQKETTKQTQTKKDENDEQFFEKLKEMNEKNKTKKTKTKKTKKTIKKKRK